MPTRELAKSDDIKENSVTTLDDSLGYRGYGNVISGNTIVNDDSMSLVGVVSLGYDFIVDNNKMDNLNDSERIAGIIVGGDGGQVTNNQMLNGTYLGIYYGGLLKFDNINYGDPYIYPSDIMGMNAMITGNTVDLSMLGLAFTGYNANIENNHLTGAELIGLASVQSAGTIKNNLIDGYSDSMMDESSDGPLGMIGLVTLCNNLTITGNTISNMSIGSLFVPFDPYAEWGNAYLSGNTMTNNMVQMAFVPGFFLFHMPDGSAGDLNTANLQSVLGANSLDRAIYITDDFDNLSTMDMNEFGIYIPMVLVFGDLNAAADAANEYADYGYTVNVMPGYYPIDSAVDVYCNGLTFLGDPDHPGNVVVDTSMIPAGDDPNAFELQANDVNVTGFTITNSLAAQGIVDETSGSGIVVGYSGPSDGSEKVSVKSVGADDCMLMNNTIENMATGIYLDDCSGADIEYNSLTNNSMGIYLTDAADANSTEIHYNDIAGNANYGVNNNDGNDRFSDYSAPPSNWVNATYNWWGSILGPHDLSDASSAGTGDNVTYYVLYEPWLNSPVFPSIASTYTYHLVGGWNLISVPLDVSDTSIAGFFPANVRSDMLTMWAWNSSNQDWVFYGSDPNDWYYTQYPALTNVETGRGYWVEMKPNTNDNFQIQGSVPVGAPESSISLNKGWNLVGLTGVSSSTPSTLYPDSFTVWNWNTSTQNWVFYGSDPNDWYYTQYPALTSLQPGYGNWVENVEV